MTYSYDLRSKALEYIEQGGSQVDASRIFGVTVQTLINWMKRKKCGNLAPNSTRKRNPQKLDGEKLKMYIDEHPDSYLREIAEEFGVTLTAVFYACKRLKITLKKRRPSIRKGMNEEEKNFKGD
ncbi:MAG: IS630 transposase-related protein [Chlamydiales bacterium]